MNNNLKSILKDIEAAVDELDFGTEPLNLYSPLDYMMNLRGKRIRPLLTLLSYSLFKPDYQSIMKAALSVEAFHNFTLIHDDIMDNAPLRRGKATVHKKWNSNIGILSGDVMLVEAYKLLSIGAAEEHLKDAMQAFNSCAKGVCEGQQLDMDFEVRNDVSLEEYIEMIRLKTAVLAGYSLELGAILGGAKEEDRLALRQFGENIGIAFQLKDDLLDAFGDGSKVGKQKGGDIISNKKTFLLIEAFRLAENNDLTLLQSWTSKEEFDPKEKVEAVLAIFEDLDLRKHCEQQMNAYFQIAINSLIGFAESDGKSNLLALADFLMVREN